MSEEKKSFSGKSFSSEKNKKFKEKHSKSFKNFPNKKKKESFVRIVIRKLPPSSTFNFQEVFDKVWKKIFEENEPEPGQTKEPNTKKYLINHYMPGKISRKRGPIYGSALVTIFNERCYDEFMQKCPSVVPLIEDDLDTIPEISMSLIQMPYTETFNDPEEGKYESSPLFALFKNQAEKEAAPATEKKVDVTKINPILEFLTKESRSSKKKDKDSKKELKLKKKEKEKLKKKEKEFNKDRSKDKPKENDKEVKKESIKEGKNKKSKKEFKKKDEKINDRVREIKPPVESTKETSEGNESSKKEILKKDTPKRNEGNKEGTKKEAQKKEGGPKKEIPKKEIPKKEILKKEAPKKESSNDGSAPKPKVNKIEKDKKKKNPYALPPNPPGAENEPSRPSFSQNNSNIQPTSASSSSSNLEKKPRFKVVYKDEIVPPPPTPIKISSLNKLPEEPKKNAPPPGFQLMRRET